MPNTPLFVPSSNILAKNPTFASGLAYSDCSSWFASANKEYFTCADNASLRVTGSFEITYWVKLTTTTTAMGIISKSTADAAANAEWGLYYSAISGKFRFALSDGTNIVRIDNTTPSTGTWYFLRAYYDSVNKIIGLSVNNGTAVTASFTGTPRVSTTQVQWGKITTDTYYLNGYLDSGSLGNTLSTPTELTTLYNAGNGQTSDTVQQVLPAWYASRVSFWDHDSESGTVYDKIGTNNLTATADPIIAPPVYGSELVVNGGFETVSGSDFGSWTETAGNGAIADETTIVHSGSHAAKITAGANPSGSPYVINTFNVTAGSTYYYAFWSRGDGTNAGRYGIFNTGVGWITAPITTNNLTTTYQLFTGQVTAPAGCTSIGIAMFAPNTTGGIAYFDDVSVKQIITPSINNGGFDDWTTPTNAAVWSEYVAGTSTVNQETTAPYSGNSALRMDGDASNSDAYVSQPIIIIGKKYKSDIYAKTNTTPCSLKIWNGSIIQINSLTTSYALYSSVFTGAHANFIIERDSFTSKSIYIDQVTLTSLGPTAEAGIAAGIATDGYNVSKVTNIASAGGQFTQITLAKRPTWDSLTLNGSLLFDGVDDGLVMTGDKIGTGDVTIFAVIRPTGWGGGSIGTILDNRALMFRISSISRIAFSSNASTTIYSAASSIALNTSYIVTVTRTSARGVNIYINGVLSGTANQDSGTPIAGSDTVLGNRAAGDRAFAGYIGMVGVIGRCLDVGSIQRLSRWLSVQSGGIY